MILTENLQKVRDDVMRCHRPITLVAATKTQPKEVVDEFAALAPEFVLGENRVQEYLSKKDFYRKKLQEKIDGLENSILLKQACNYDL